MFARLQRSLDHAAISAACSLSQSGVGQPGQVSRARQLLADPKFFCFDGYPPLELKFHNRTRFTFATPEASPWPENNTGYGHFHTCGSNWRSRPTVILLHGWNAELCYRYLFPYIGGRARKRGLNTLFFELPLHCQRRPCGQDVVRDWISDDLHSMLRATRQALLEIDGIAQWLKQQGSPKVSTWGFSLGAWLAGLHLCYSSFVDYSVLATPVVRMDLLIETLSFCAPIRNALHGETFDLSNLNLRMQKPRIDSKNILLVEPLHDQFAPPETIDDLNRTWTGSELWRISHGHISALFSLPLVERTLRWLESNMTRGN